MNASRRDRHVRALALLLAGLAAPLGAQGAPPDPFYTGLLRDGRAASVRGDLAGARHDLRLACFGLLEHPSLLAECRVRLALAEAAQGDKESFLESFRRLEEIEERFQSYAQAAVTAEERRAFEEKVQEWVPPETLRTIPLFAHLAARKAESDLAKLTPRERVAELERRAAAEPGDATWKVQLAREELARRRPAPALDRLDKLPNDAAGGEAGCLRGRALAELDRCAEAAAPLAACASARTDAGLADLLLACLIELERGDEARAFAAGLAAPVAARPEIRKRIGKIPAADRPKPVVAAGSAESASARESAKPPAKSPPKVAAQPAERPAARPLQTAAPAPPPESAPRAEPPAQQAQSAKPAEAAPAPGPTAAERRTAADVRKRMLSAATRQELEAEMKRVRPIADRHPADLELQALVGELGYRAGQWTTGAVYLGRMGASGPADPTLRFYLAVCQYESGDRAAAARTAASGLDKLPRSPFVDGYLKKIQEPPPPSR